jgi:anti-sigma B factor antagonist
MNGDDVRHPTVTEHRIQSGVTALRVTGELDLASVGPFEAALARAVKQDRTPMVIDLAGCRFIDSSVLRSLIDLRTQLENGDQPQFAVVAEAQPLRVLRLTGLDGLIPVFGSLHDALQSLPAARGADGRAGDGSDRPSRDDGAGL